MDTQTPTHDPTYALELRRIGIEEGRLALERQRLDNERRDTRTPAEVDFDLAVRMATTLADSPVLYYDEDRVKKIAEAEGWDDTAGSRARAFAVARRAYQTERIAFACQLLSYAQAMDVPLALLAGQAHIVKGRVGFATTYLIALVNARGRLTAPIDWTVSGSGDALAVTCSAGDAGGVVREVTITMTQAKTWGWANSTGPWKADPALMLRYRTAAQLIRLYFSSAVFGLPLVSVEELRDIRDGIIEGESSPVQRVRGPLALPEGVVPAAPPPLPDPVPVPVAAPPPTLDEVFAGKRSRKAAPAVEPPTPDELRALERAHPEIADHARHVAGISETVLAGDIPPEKRLMIAVEIGRQLPPGESRW